MPYTPLGLGAKIVEAIRSVTTDPTLQPQIDAVRASMDALTSQLSSVTASDAAQQETLDGVVAELGGLATALTGPADDPTDNGVIGEVEPAPDAEPSPSADAAVEG